MGTRIESTNSDKFLDVSFELEQWWDDDELQSQINIEGVAHFEGGPFNINFLAGYTLDEIKSAIDKLIEFERRLKGEVAINFSGCDKSYENTVALNVTFLAIDSVGHIAGKITYKKATRYSNDKDFVFTIQDEFQVYPETLSKVLSKLKSIVASDKSNA